MTTPTDQLDRLLDAGLGDVTDLRVGELRAQAARLPDVPGAVLAVHPRAAPPSRLAPLLRRQGKPGFVVVDMTDLDEFVPIEGVSLPDAPLYLLTDVDRGDDLRSWSPDEALPEITGRDRTPLTVGEGISWLLAEPDRLEPNHCFMTIGSRLRRGSRLDARTPAIWISSGTGRDGRDAARAPKVGWCWAGNRHTWLGFASAGVRVG
ncbi:DUF5701 family protein [Nocardioides sp. CFH 31398]|uniref:DUF5701 family protein n=1 Tax=Nocardioides sp. CFH 31398 TaxID=2919579 RepID=UPI001F054D34|nr:DUF5701 family protein [Nocardioides sp. CFH 31398]MCH1865428.1 DUF5701 family protein [Nocardioides sp. CFH 31398]